VTGSGRNLAITLTLTFTPSFSGAKSIFLRASSTGGTSGYDLLGSWTVPQNAPASFGGWQDTAGCSSIDGWAWDRNRPNTPVNVDIYDATTLLATVAANIFRSDLVGAGIGNGYHGFRWAVPAWLRDGRMHQIRARVSGADSDLAGSPKTITCSNRYEGYYDGLSCTLLNGWIWYPDQPDTPVNVDIYSDALLLGTIPANLFRSDLQAAGKGSGYHAFGWPIPALLRDGRMHQIDVTVSGTQIKLAGGPKSINCTALFEGFHDSATCTGVSGWAWDDSQPNTPVYVDIYDDNILLATVPANLFRSDLLAAGKGNGYHGFNWPLPAALRNGQPHILRIRFGQTGISLGSTPRTVTCP
jgi:hypothetical protein